MNNKNEQQMNPVQAQEQLLAQRLSAKTFEISKEQRSLIAKLQQPAVLLHVARTMLCGLSQVAYKHLIRLDPTADLTLLEASHFVTLADRMTPVQMGMTLDEYEAFLDDMEAVIDAWNATVEPMKRAAEKEVMTKFSKQILIPKKKNIILPGRSN